MLFRHHVNNVGEVSVSSQQRTACATFWRSSLASPCPPGWSRLVSVTRKVSLSELLVFIGGSMGTSSAISWSGRCYDRSMPSPRPVTTPADD